MKTPYCKPHLTIEDQLNLLIDRGLIVLDKENAKQILSSINYYRLSGYLYLLKARNDEGLVVDKFVDNSDLSTALKLYEFDRKLRLLVLDALERIEVAVRCQIAYNFSKLYGPFGYADSANFHDKFKSGHDELLKFISKEAGRAREYFIERYKSKYDGFPQLPLWMLVEILSFNSLSRFYSGLKICDKPKISSYFNVHYKSLEDYLRSLSYIRNICAHHSRLWNRELSIKIQKTKDPPWLPKPWLSEIKPKNNRVSCIFLILKYLLLATGNDTEWGVDLKNLIRPIAQNNEWRTAMGLPDEWENYL